MFIRLQRGVECIFPPIIDTYFTQIFMIMRQEHVRMVWFIAHVMTLERVAVCNVQRCELIPHASVHRKRQRFGTYFGYHLLACGLWLGGCGRWRRGRQCAQDMRFQRYGRFLQVYGQEKRPHRGHVQAPLCV